MKVAAASFVFGFLSVGLLLFCFALGLGIIADVRGWGSFHIGSGLLTILDYERTPDGTEAVVGGGIVVLALLAGILNAVAGMVLWLSARPLRGLVSLGGRGPPLPHAKRDPASPERPKS